MIEIWDERNLQACSKANCKINLKQRVLEHFYNREKYNHEINDYVENVRDKMEGMTKDKLCVKLEIIRDKIKKAKEMKK